MVSRKSPSSHALFSQRLDSSLSQGSPPATTAEQPLSFENQQQGLVEAGLEVADADRGEMEPENVWTAPSTSDQLQNDLLPASLRLGATAPEVHHSEPQNIPTSLQPGLGDFTPRSSWESERGPRPEAEVGGLADISQDTVASTTQPSSTNPFRRPHEPVPGQAAPGLSQYSEVSNANPWSTEPSNPSTVPPLDDLDDDRDIWNKLPPSPPKKSATLAQLETQEDISSDQQDPGLSNHHWRNQAAALGASPIPNYTRIGNSFAGLVESRHLSPQESGKEVAQASRANGSQQQEQQQHEEAPSQRGERSQREGQTPQHQKETSQQQDLFPYDLEPHRVSPFAGSPGPSVPPQQLLETASPTHGIPGPSVSPQQLLETPLVPPAQPPRPSQSTMPASDNAGQDTSSGLQPKKPSGTYQIRLITWFDESSPTNPRKSPIMMQNANGPCPLLALVNALVLSTPSTTTTGLVETLRVREQISLEFLLNAVIDELLSDRRVDAAQNLPDVSDLYDFLTALHEGMNVNPRFIAVEEPINLMDAPIDAPSRTHDYRKPGGFEQTREINLYSTFSIPLIHGWIPPMSHPAFASLKRVGNTYEDAQNILFREEELENKLKNGFLSQEEQITLQDIASINYFLDSTKTQLTLYGLDMVTESLAPGSIAILFRNAHFTTLYRHPRSGQLLTLVTDMGFVGHDEVVWQSLVDVNENGSEFYSGDFRPVRSIPQNTQQANGITNPDDEEGWEPSPPRSRRNLQPTSGSEMPRLDTLNIATTNATPISPITEQEDHDLALAMQLQEEEEDRQRRSTAARRREDELSQAYLNNADASGRRTFPGFGRGAGGAGNGGRGGGNIRPNVPPRGGSTTQQPPRGGRAAPATHRPVSSSEDAPPPSYEQAAKTPTYHPPADHPSYAPSPNSGGLPRPLPPRPRDSSSAYSETVIAGGRGRYPIQRGRGSGSGIDGPGLGRRRPGEVAGGPADGVDEIRRERDCVIM